MPKKAISWLLDPRSDMKAIHSLLTVGLGVLVLSTVIVLAGFTTLGIGNVRSGADMPATLAFEKVIPAGANLPPGVQVESLKVSVPIVYRTITDHVLLRMAILPLIFLAMAVVWHLRRVVGSVLAGDPFVVANVARLRWIAWLLITSPFVIFISDVAKNELLSRSSVGDLTQESVSFYLAPVLIGALILVLSQVFASGVALRQEAEGVV